MRLVKVNGTGVDVNVFQFDYYMQWAAIFMNRHGHVYARYGSRRENKNQDESLMSLAGIRSVMKRVLEAHKGDADRNPANTAAPRYAETLAKVPEKMRSGAQCMHCHHILVHGRGELPSYFQKAPNLPPPETLGMSLDVNLGNVVRSVEPGGRAATAGIVANDEILSVNGVPAYSSADLSWLLYTRRANEPIKVEFSRGKEKRQATLP